MKKISVLLLLAVAAFSQEHFSTRPQVSVSVGRHATITERLDGKVHDVYITARHADGTIFATRHIHNLRTNAGADAQASQMANFGSQVPACAYIALSNDSTAPVATDTVLAGEINNTNGAGRAQGTYAHTLGTAQLTQSHVFSIGPGSVSSQKSGVFNASSSGTMCWEAAYSQINNVNGDTLTVTWTVNY